VRIVLALVRLPRSAVRFGVAFPEAFSEADKRFYDPKGRNSSKIKESGQVSV